MPDLITISDPVTVYRQRINALLGDDDALAASQVGSVGVAGQVRAGRQLALADFTTLLGLGTPRGLFGLADASNLGTGTALTNKGTVTFNKGITGASGEAAQFTGAVAQALYAADTGAADPYRIGYGSFGAWFRTAKRGTLEAIMGKWNAAGGAAYVLLIGTTNQVSVFSSATGAVGVAETDYTSVTAAPDVCDDRWHHVVGVIDTTSVAIYLDGALAGRKQFYGGAFPGAAPFNVGNYNATAGTSPTGDGAAPFYGRVDEAFVTLDVLTEDQVRMLYAARVPHGLGVTPTAVDLSVRRRQRGGTLAVADFPAQPVRLHNFNLSTSVLADEGSGGVALTLNGAASSTAGADGASGQALNLVASGSQYASASDTGLPTGATARTIGAWFRSSAATATLPILGYGSAATGPQLHVVTSTGTLAFVDGGTTHDTGVAVADGLWHHAAVVTDNSAADGLKVKVYLDGKLVYSSTATAGTATLLGANGFRIGRGRDTSTAYFNGGIDGVFVAAASYTPEQVRALYGKGSRPLPASPKNAGDHVEGATDTDVYLVCDTLEPQHTLDLAVA